MDCYKFSYIYEKWLRKRILKNRETIWNRAKEFLENNKEVLKAKAKNKYRKLSEEEKNIKREYGRNRSHIMSEEKKKD